MGFDCVLTSLQISETGKNLFSYCYCGSMKELATFQPSTSYSGCLAQLCFLAPVELLQKVSITFTGRSTAAEMSWSSAVCAGASSSAVALH